MVPQEACVPDMQPSLFSGIPKSKKGLVVTGDVLIAMGKASERR
jgi:hypothetical protein